MIQVHHELLNPDVLTRGTMARTLFWYCLQHPEAVFPALLKTETRSVEEKRLYSPRWTGVQADFGFEPRAALDLLTSAAYPEESSPEIFDSSEPFKPLKRATAIVLKIFFDDASESQTFLIDSLCDELRKVKSVPRDTLSLFAGLSTP